MFREYTKPTTPPPSPPMKGTFWIEFVPSLLKWKYCNLWTICSKQALQQLQTKKIKSCFFAIKFTFAISLPFYGRIFLWLCNTISFVIGLISKVENAVNLHFLFSLRSPDSSVLVFGCCVFRLPGKRACECLRLIMVTIKHTWISTNDKSHHKFINFLKIHIYVQKSMFRFRFPCQRQSDGTEQHIFLKCFFFVRCPIFSKEKKKQRCFTKCLQQNQHGNRFTWHIICSFEK